MPLVLYTRCQPFPRIKGGTCTPAVASGKRVRAAFTQTYWYSTAAELTFSAPWSANHFLPYAERKRLPLSTLGLGFALGLPVIRCFCFFVHSDPQPQPALPQHKVFRGSCRGRRDCVNGCFLNNQKRRISRRTVHPTGATDPCLLRQYGHCCCCCCCCRCGVCYPHLGLSPERGGAAATPPTTTSTTWYYTIPYHTIAFGTLDGPKTMHSPMFTQ